MKRRLRQMGNLTGCQYNTGTIARARFWHGSDQPIHTLTVQTMEADEFVRAAETRTTGSG